MLSAVPPLLKREVVAVEKVTHFRSNPKYLPSFGWRLRIAWRRVERFYETHPLVQAVSVGLFMLGAGYALLFALLAVL
jgi:hypothetical protein